MPPEDLLRTCKQARYQGSGPGGQKRNRVYSGIRLVHGESGIAIESEASRESRRNLEEALHRLRLTMALSMAPSISQALIPLDKPLDEVPSIAQDKIPFRANASPNHIDFPVLVLRALYYFDKHRGQVALTAQVLGCTASALARFFKADKGLWVRAKEIREANGLHPLK